MELSIFTKAKITASIVIGVLVIGVVAWPMIEPATSFDVVAFYQSNINFAKLFLICLLAIVASFVSGLISRPYSKQIAVLTAPAGLCIFALFSGDMTSLLKANPTVEAQQSVYSALRFESFLWLLVVIAGMFGAVLSHIVWPGKDNGKLLEKQILLPTKKDKNTVYLNIAAALVGSAIVADIIIKILARDVIVSKFSASVVAQPANLQSNFAVFIGFVIAAFVTKLFLRTSYLWPTLATVIVCCFEMISGGRAKVLESLAQHWPIGFYFQASNAILPIQYVAFGALGSVVGYWWAIRYAWWREHEMNG